MMAEASDIRALTGSPAWRPLTAALLGAVLSACGGPAGDAEEQIRAWIDRGHQAAERKDRRELAAMISPNYADARGNSRDDLDKLFRYYFLRTGNVELLVSIDDIEIHGETAAEVTLTVGMGATSGGLPGFNADVYRFELEIEHHGNDWSLVSGRWHDFGSEWR